jgi:hypothetical protein
MEVSRVPLGGCFWFGRFGGGLGYEDGVGDLTAKIIGMEHVGEVRLVFVYVPSHHSKERWVIFHELLFSSSYIGFDRFDHM